MPSPTRAPSVRSSTNEPKTAAARSVRSTFKPPQSPIKSKSERERLDGGSSATSTKESMNGSQASSRIPSPFKRNPSSQSSHSQQVQAVPTKPPSDKGHVRQRSAVVPLLNAPKRFGHSRSASAVSVNTSTSTSSNDALRSIRRPGPDPSKLRSAVPRPNLGSTQSSTSSLTATTTRSSSVYAQVELVQNELLQLSTVYKQSSRTMQAYQRSIDGFLATKQAEISSKRGIVQARKQNFCAALNLLGLDSWLSLDGHQKTCQSLQNLSIAVRDLQNLESIFEGSDGLAAAFDDWQQNMCRRGSTEDVARSTEFITLHTVFESRLVPEIRRFKQQVSSVLASLSNLPESPPDTSLASMIHGHTALAVSLASQCQIMLEIGNVLVADHCQWLQDEVQAAISAKSGRSDEQPPIQSTPIWDI